MIYSSAPKPPNDARNRMVMDRHRCPHYKCKIIYYCHRNCFDTWLTRIYLPCTNK